MRIIVYIWPDIYIYAMWLLFFWENCFLVYMYYTDPAIGPLLLVKIVRIIFEYLWYSLVKSGQSTMVKDGRQCPQTWQAVIRIFVTEAATIAASTVAEIWPIGVFTCRSVTTPSWIEWTFINVISTQLTCDSQYCHMLMSAGSKIWHL